MNITINTDKVVDLTAMSILFDFNQVSIQWLEMIKDQKGNWIDDPDKPNVIVCSIANNATDFTNFVSETYTNQIAQITTFIDNYYSNLTLI